MTSNSEIALVEKRTCCAPAAGIRISDAEAHEIATAFKAVGHPVRLQILDVLSRSEGQLCVCDVEACFSLSQPTISHHLRVLREAGLVGAEQRGLWAFYYVRRDNVEKLRTVLAGLRETSQS
jgi:ArsR family transcriptional regulator